MTKDFLIIVNTIGLKEPLHDKYQSVEGIF